MQRNWRREKLPLRLVRRTRILWVGWPRILEVGAARWFAGGFSVRNRLLVTLEVGAVVCWLRILVVGAEDRLLAEDLEVGAMGRLLEVWRSGSFAEGWHCRVPRILEVGAEGRLLAEDLDVCTGIVVLPKIGWR